MSLSQPAVTKKKSGVLGLWNDYWFYPAPLFNLAICRILIIGFQLGYLFLEDYLPNVLAQAAIPGRTFSPLPVFELLNAPFPWSAPPAFFLWTACLATAISGALSLIGLKTNLNLLIFAVGNLYLQTYLFSFGSFHHPEAIMLIALFVLALSPAGRVLSIDDLSRRLKRNVRQRKFQAFSVLAESSAMARWPLLLIQWLMAIAYFSAALNKLSVDGAGLFSADWMNGYTLQYYLLSDGLTWGSDLGIWLGQQHTLAVISSWVAILFEATFFFTIFFPRLVWLYIPTGALFHIGIYFAQRAPFFQYIAIYVVFIPWTALVKSISNRLKSSHRPKPEVYCQRSSPKNIRLMTVLCYFDWFKRLDYRHLEPDHDQTKRQSSPGRPTKETLPELQLIQPNGRTEKGFFALRESIKYVPPLWPLLALMYLPGASEHQL